MYVILVLFSILVGIIFGAVGGALVGKTIGGKDLGNGFAALMGSLFCLSAAVPGVIVGIIILALWR